MEINSKDEWQRTFDAISDIVFILDRDNTIIKVNKAFLDFTGLKLKEVIGRKCYELMHKIDKPWPLCPHQETIKDGKPHTQEVDDPVLGAPFLMTTSPIFDAQGEVRGSVHIAKDISEIKKIQKELEKKIADLERFQKITIDREKRVIELKDEVRNLRFRLDEKE